MIRGEHVFTAAVRERWQKRIDKMVRNLRKRAAALEVLGTQLPKTTGKPADLLAWIRELEGARGWHQSDDYVALDDDSLESYVLDYRKTCAHCKRKRHGGVTGLVLSRRHEFYCDEGPCRTAHDRAIAADKRKHPKLYAAAEARSRKLRMMPIRRMRRLKRLKGRR